MYKDRVVDKVKLKIEHYLILYKMGELRRWEASKAIVDIEVGDKTIKEVIEEYEKTK